MNLSVAATQDGFHAKGLFDGALSDFSFSPQKIQGTIATCSYDLKWADDGYVGARACGNGIEQVSLELPQTLAQRSATEVAATLALFLGRD